MVRLIKIEYRQFYIADAIIEPLAPEEWSDEDLYNHYNLKNNIVALAAEDSGIFEFELIWPNEKYIQENPLENVIFKRIIKIEIPNGLIGLFEWPWTKIEEYNGKPGKYNIEYYYINDIDKNKIKYRILINEENSV